MPQKTEAQKKAQKAYMQKFSRMEIRVSPELRDAIQAHATGRGESVNGFIGRAISNQMELDNQETQEAQEAECDGD